MKIKTKTLFYEGYRITQIASAIAPNQVAYFVTNTFSDSIPEKVFLSKMEAMNYIVERTIDKSHT